MVPSSLRILNYKRLRNLSLPLSARLVLKSRRNRIAQPSSLDEAKRQRMETKLLGIDVGTGGTRAVLLDEAGRVLGAATAEHAPMSSAELGWAEQDPRDWWRAARGAIAECLMKANATAKEIAAIGLSGQMHGLVLLDAAGEGGGPARFLWGPRAPGGGRAVSRRVGGQPATGLAGDAPAA